MKRIQFLFVIMILSSIGIICAQDTVFVMKAGNIAFKQAVNNLDSISFLNSKHINIVEKIAQDKRFSLFNEALLATGYAELILNTPAQDRQYNPNNCPWVPKTFNIKEEIPKYRRIGFTILMESDSILANYKDCPLCPNGVQNLRDLEKLAEYFYSKSYVGLYSDGDVVIDLKDKRNYLNRFVAYHCLDRKLSTSRFINDFDTPNQFKTSDLDEYIETMLDNSLLKVKKSRMFNLTFSFNMLIDNDLSTAVQLTNVHYLGYNGFYHGINKPLVYSKAVNTLISSNRIRMDVASFFKELATNDMRGNNPTAVNVVGKAHRYIIPPDYFDNLKTSSLTRFTYVNANGIYIDYEGDEFYIEGQYDFSIITPPLPKGTYEIRLGYQATDWRGTAQVSLDSINCGPPIKFSLLFPGIKNQLFESGAIPNINSYVSDSLLRTVGYMRGPNSYSATISLYYTAGQSAMYFQGCMRKIIGTFTFDVARKHTIRITNTNTTNYNSDFMLDYIEFVPIEYLDKEGID